MSTKVQGTNGIEFPDGSVQSSAAYSKAEMPMVAFVAEQQTDPFVQLPSGVAVKCLFNTIKRNDGGGYNAETATFTAPVAGWYSFTAGVAMHQVTNYSEVQLRFGDSINAVQRNNGNDVGRLQTTALVYLVAGSTIDVQYAQTSASLMYQGWNGWQVYFSGILVKAGA